MKLVRDSKLLKLQTSNIDSYAMQYIKTQKVRFSKIFKKSKILCTSTSFLIQPPTIQFIYISVSQPEVLGACHRYQVVHGTQDFFSFTNCMK